MEAATGKRAIFAAGYRFRRVGALRLASLGFSAAIGAAVPLCGFTPFNHADDVLAISEQPWRVVLMPAVLLALLAVIAAAVVPARRPAVPPVAFVAGAALLLVAAMASIASSIDPTASALTAVVAVAVPILIVYSLSHADLHAPTLLGSFLGMTTVLLLRADVVFFSTSGLPTPGALFEAKFSNTAYDFHYYTLGNPDHTAGFLLMPLALAVFWSLDRKLGRLPRLLLLGAAAVTLLTLTLTYARVASLTGLALLAVAVSVAPTRPRTRRVLQLGVACIAIGFLVAASSYLVDLFSTERSASAPERITSVKDGLVMLSEEPAAGFGLGQYGPAGGYTPAHSSIVQAGAEMGVLGLAALILLTGSLVVHATSVIRGFGWRGLGPAAAIAAGVYALHAAVASPASEGLYSGYVSVWGLTVALLLGISLRFQTTGRGA